MRCFPLGVVLVWAAFGAAAFLVHGTAASAQDPTAQDPTAQETPSSPQPSASPEAGAEQASAPQGQAQDDPQAMQEALQSLPEDVREEAQEAWDRFVEMTPKLAAEMLELRTIQLRYRNGYDQTPAAVARFREQRIQTWNAMQQQFTYALDLIRYLPSMEAASYVVTMIQHHYENDIYDAATFEGAARLLDMGQNLRFLFLAGARSAVVTGNFEAAKNIYESLEDKDLETADLNLKYQLDKLEEQWQREQQAIENTDPESLPQVKFSTTKGDFIVELFPEAAPSAVAHFLKLVRNGFYDGMDFSLVTQNILALTGDASGDGRGNSGEFLVDEHAHEHSRPALRGSLTMAKLPLGEGQFIANSASSQFAICYLPIPSMSADQTIFGRVIEGMDVVSRLRRVDPTKKKEASEVLLPPDAIFSAEILRPGKDLPEPVYVDVQAELDKAVEAGLLRRKDP